MKVTLVRTFERAVVAFGLLDPGQGEKKLEAGRRLYLVFESVDVAKE